MASPFSSLANASLRFQVSSGVLEADPETGNIKPTLLVMQVSALLSQKSRANRQARPGVDSTAIYLEGFVTEVIGAENPLLLPPIITPDSPCQAIWDGKNGRFFLELTGRSPYGTANILGDKIRGFFQLSSFVVDGGLWMAAGVPRKLAREAVEVAIAGQTSFTLADSAQRPELSEFYVNGVKAVYALEYTLNGSQLNWLVNDLTLAPEDELEILYYKA